VCDADRPDRDSEQRQAPGNARDRAFASQAVDPDAVTRPEITDAGRSRAPGSRGAKEDACAQAGSQRQVDQRWRLTVDYA
jgi:hypothetical protein